jgi:hypothetical protein
VKPAEWLLMPIKIKQPYSKGILIPSIPMSFFNPPVTCRKGIPMPLETPLGKGDPPQ